MAQLQQQLRALLRERAEDRARAAGMQQQLAAVQQAQARALRQVAPPPPPEWPAGSARLHQPVDPMETWLEETMSTADLPPNPVPAQQAWHQPLAVLVPPHGQAHPWPAAAAPAPQPAPALQRQKQATLDDLAQVLAALRQ